LRGFKKLKKYCGKMISGLKFRGKTAGNLTLLFLIFVLLSGSSSEISAMSCVSGIYIKAISGTVTQLPVSLFHLILTLLGLAVVIIIIVLFFSKKLKNVNKELKLKNREIENVNLSLEKKTNELAAQKEQIARELSDSEKFFGKLIQSADDGFSFYDKHWNLSYSNEAFYSIIGFDKESYNSADHASLFHPDDIEFPAKRAEALSRNGFFESELRLRHRDGHYMNLSTRSVVVKDDNGETIGALTISRDITSLTNVHDQLVQAKFEAEASNKLKASFLANISHEIRTPLNSVIGFSNLLLSNDLTREVKEEYIEHINHNSEKLLQIIGDIIDLSRLESSQMEITYEEASVSEVINEVIEETRQSIKRNEKPIILTVKNQFEDNGDLIFTDRMWLKRVLTHLLDNAVKFTLEGSVEFSYGRENDNILFKIKDTGIGIKKENLGKIFEEFSQEINGHHRPFEGLGVGLTLAKEVLDRMGGKIFVKSEKGIGSEFSFTIPYRPAGSSKFKNHPAEQSSGPQNWSSKKCLLVDDNKDVLIYLNRILLDTGINIATARSGPEAIEIIKKDAGIDIVLMDMQMPEMNGIEATKEIRKIRKDLPIIAQTAFIFEDDKDIILEAGCDACLIKPIRKEHLLTTLSGFIKIT
jgi:PAS domain S-box-containing protein